MVLAAGTTILAMIPLLNDPVFASMAVSIMGGLGFASVLTLVGVPVLYQSYLRKERRAEDAVSYAVKREAKEARRLAKRNTCQATKAAKADDDEGKNTDIMTPQPVAAE